MSQYSFAFCLRVKAQNRNLIITSLMAFVQISGPVKVIAAMNKASTAVQAGAAVISSSGYMVPVGETSTDCFGVNLSPKASTDSDYTSNTPALYVLAHAEAEFLIDVTTGSATAAIVGTFIDFDGTTGTGVDVGTSTHHQVLVTGIVDTTHIKGKIVAASQFKNAA